MAPGADGCSVSTAEVDERPVAVLGPNRLIADIIGSVIGDLPADALPIAVLVDPHMEHWHAVGDRPAIAVLSEPSDVAVLEAIRRGANAVIDSHAVLTELPRLVTIVRGGGVVLTPHQAQLVVTAFRSGAGRDSISLTRRETDIIRSVMAGDSVKQTAIRLGIAQKTVENLQRRLFRKLDVRNRAQAVARVHELGLLQIDLRAEPES